MANTQSYADLDELRNAGVEDDFVVESNDYVENMPPLPKVYLSPSRTLGKITRKEDKSITFELVFDTGIHDTESGKIHSVGKFPMKTWISTKVFIPQSGVGFTSSAAQYLAKIGFDTKGMTQGDMLTAIGESVNTPVGVRVDWEDKGKKQEDGTYTSLKLKSKDFQTGTDAEGNITYSPRLTRNGEVVEARAKINGFRTVTQ